MTPRKNSRQQESHWPIATSGAIRSQGVPERFGASFSFPRSPNEPEQQPTRLKTL